MNTKSSIFTSDVAMSENTSFGVQGWNKIWSYTENYFIYNNQAS